MGLKRKNNTRRQATSPTINSATLELDEEELVGNGTLTSKKRDDLGEAEFALPESRRYPIPDEAHARDALSRISQFGTTAEKAKVRAAVKRKFPGMDANDDKDAGATANQSTLVNNDEDDAWVENELQEITFNIGGASIRYEQLEGRDYMVAPAVMIVEGVLNGSNGPLFYPAKELAKTPMVWDHKPITLFHPLQNGSPVSGCAPSVISAQKLGMMLNTKFVAGRGGKPNKLKTEAWLELNSLKKKAPDVLNSLKKGEPVEISTGLFTDNEPTEGVWKGKRYDSIARNYRPDHLALLPGAKGACSVEDGAGLLRNAQGDGMESSGRVTDLNIRKQLNQKIKTRKTIPSGLRLAEGPPQPYLRDIYGTFCVYCLGDSLYKQDYSTDGNGVVKLSGQPQEVTGKTQYMTTDGTVINTQGVPMKSRKDFVDALIENADWEEKDRSFLMSVDRDKFVKLCANAGLVVNASQTRRDGQDYAGGKGEEGDEDDQGETVEDGAGQVKPKKMGSKSGATDNKGDKFPKRGNGKGGGSTKTPSEEDDEFNDEDKASMNMENMDPEEFIANAKMPQAVREVLASGLQIQNQTKRRLIKAITDNKANHFDREFLATQPLNVLQGMAALAESGKRQDRPAINFSGMGDVDSQQVANEEEPLAAPVFNFDRQSTKAN